MAGYLIGITMGPLGSDLVGARVVVLISAVLLFTTSGIIRNF